MLDKNLEPCVIESGLRVNEIVAFNSRIASGYVGKGFTEVGGRISPFVPYIELFNGKFFYSWLSCIVMK